MTRVTITLEDMPDGSVRVSSDPSFKELTVQMRESLKGLAPWPGSLDYALPMLTGALNRSREAAAVDVTPLKGTPDDHKNS